MKKSSRKKDTNKIIVYWTWNIEKNNEKSFAYTLYKLYKISNQKQTPKTCPKSIRSEQNCRTFSLFAFGYS